MKIPKLLNRISVDPHILHGQARIKQTRVAVSMVLELLAEGHSPQEICERFYPDITPKDIYACIAFANQFLNEEEIHFLKDRKHVLQT